MSQTTTLSAETIAIVKSTAPVLAEHGYKITCTMYGKMLTENPEVKNLFNQTHQVVLSGEKKARQPAALAAAVHAYAANIDNLGALGEAVELIAQKHAALYVLPEHYPVVAENLLWAIKEVLGDAATPEIMKAWGEAYWFLANIFIKRETEIREGRAAEPGGWEGWREFIVAEKVKESDEIVSFHLRPADGGKILAYEAGSYTSLRIETPEFIAQRNYTISMPPGNDQYRITVKRIGADAEGHPPGVVSSYLHDKLQKGDTLKLGVPCGDFLLKPDPSKPIVLLSGGVGITPIISMLGYLADTKFSNKVIMIHSARSPNVEALHEELEKYRRGNLNIVVKNVYDACDDGSLVGPLTMEKLDSVLWSRDCHYYFCGPPRFLKTFGTGLQGWGIPKEQIHYEYFGPFGNIADE